MLIASSVTGILSRIVELNLLKEFIKAAEI